MPPERQSPTRTLLSLVAGAIAYSLAQTMILPALPAIQAETGTSEAAVSWLLTAFLLVASVAPPIIGRLGDMFGKERLLLVTLVLFGLGSIVCALGTSSLGLLIAGRVIQGAGGAVFPLSYGIIRDEFPPERVATSIGIISAVFGIGGGFGLVLAGVMVDHLSVASLFWVSLGVTAAAALATWRWVPESPVRAPARIDWGGGALLSFSLIAVLLGVSQGPDWGWTSGGVLGLIVGGLVLLAVFIIYETRIAQPLVDMAIMAQRAVWSPNVAAFAIGFAMFGSFILIPQLVEAPESTGYGFGLSATGAGLVLLPSSLMMLVVGPLAGWLGSRFGSRLPLALGAMFAAAAFAVLTFAHGELWTIAFGGGLLGVGISLALAAMANLVVNSVEPTQTGVATGINTITRNIGGAVGGQITASLLASHALASGHVAESGYTIAFAISGVAALAALAVCLLVPNPRRAAARPARLAA
ncbi:MFS transporter [Capillimicrobium parvum]|uniref:Multidrug resistance protein 3 n=1 Tax=Capillimicrobium parvum TaxID=2884022 RepID=A0A9E6XY49_9ACTN|nr:MFS transporter [Capillimicrobium parvum]UGS36647.1 Multidrug resistance protein 3 [Capillimicrobium parvum]